MIHFVIAESDQAALVAEQVMAPGVPVPLPVPDHDVRLHQAAVAALYLRDQLKPSHQLPLSCVCQPAHHDHHDQVILTSLVSDLHSSQAHLSGLASLVPGLWRAPWVTQHWPSSTLVITCGLS